PYLYFSSSASNIVSGDLNDSLDVFRKDLLTGEVTIISRTSSGALLDGAFGGRVSDNGRYLLFSSGDPDLGGPENDAQLYRKDLATGTVKPVSTNARNEWANGDLWVEYDISANGRYAVFTSGASNLVDNDTNGRVDIFRKDLETGAVARVSVAAKGEEANDYSSYASISSDGSFVIFESNADNLVENDTNGTGDVFLKNIETGAVRLLSTSSSPNPVQANFWSGEAVLSGNDRYVFFSSTANNLVENDTNGNDDFFRKDLVTGQTIRVSVDGQGQQIEGVGGSIAVSFDGRYVAFATSAQLDSRDTNYEDDVYLKDLVTGSVRLVSVTRGGLVGEEDSVASGISADGRYVFFESGSTLLKPGSNGVVNIFRKDIVTGELVCLTTGPAVPGLEEGNASSYDPFISADGQTVIFGSQADNLVAGDTGGWDIFGTNMASYALAQAALEGRYIQATLGVGTAWSGSVAWDDGAVNVITPANGVAHIAHAFASAGVHGATITLYEGGQNWKVAYLVNMQTGQLSRNFSQFDTVEGGAGSDVLTGDAHANHLAGNLGHDTLEGGAGADILEGGLGNDTYLVDTSNALVEGTGGGIDTVIATTSYA
ncbi:MAG: hypothetical protein ICV68_18405, partial [Pyrinomonadaceae bacterium]|nr:hypothetical protein [Pyrinomonadaceae bacterium]